MAKTKNRLKFIHISGMYPPRDNWQRRNWADFQRQNWIKTGICNRLCIERLDQLMRVSSAKVNREDLDFEAAHDQFVQMVLRRI